MNCSDPNTLSMKYLCPVVNLGENLALTKVWSTVCPVYVTWALSYNREHLSFFSSSEYETHQWDSFQRKLFEKTGLTTLESPSTLRLHPATLRGTLETDKICDLFEDNSLKDLILVLRINVLPLPSVIPSLSWNFTSALLDCWTWRELPERRFTIVSYS